LGTLLVLIPIRWYLPKRFFVFVVVNGFPTAGFAGNVTGHRPPPPRVAGGAWRLAQPGRTFPPGAILSGRVVVVLVPSQAGRLKNISPPLSAGLPTAGPGQKRIRASGRSAERLIGRGHLAQREKTSSAPPRGGAMCYKCGPTNRGGH
jgi:hypothetical protein